MTRLSTRPRLLGLICGAGAVAMGLAYMSMAGAPARYLVINFAALVLGAIAWLVLGRMAGERSGSAGIAVLALAVPLLLTALFGNAIDGASRWMSVGALNVQVSLIVLPVMIVLYARRPDTVGTIGLMMAALALALQPDRAMAGVLLAGLAALLTVKPNRLTILTTITAALAFGWTMFAPDTLPAAPYVDRIFYTAFDVHPLAGLAVIIGAAALLVPAATGVFGETGEKPVLLAFAGCWSAVVVAAALGNYPTPLVGYGGSAVLGYLLSVALLSNGARGPSSGEALEPRPATDRNYDRDTSELSQLTA